MIRSETVIGLDPTIVTGVSACPFTNLPPPCSMLRRHCRPPRVEGTIFCIGHPSILFASCDPVPSTAACFGIAAVCRPSCLQTGSSRRRHHHRLTVGGLHWLLGTGVASSTAPHGAVPARVWLLIFLAQESVFAADRNVRPVVATCTGSGNVAGQCSQQPLWHRIGIPAPAGPPHRGCLTSRRWNPTPDWVGHHRRSLSHHLRC